MKKLLLLGGGHAHVHVLRTLTEAPLAGVDVTLVSPYARQVYSGMLPGWVAGHYALDQCVIPLPPLCARAGVRHVETAADAIDFAANTVRCADGSNLAFDVLSIDTGPVADLSIVAAAAEHGIPVRPIETFIAAYEQLRGEVAARAARNEATEIVFVGAGAAGIELALAMQYAFRATPVRLTLVSAANTLPGSVGPRLARHLQAAGVQLLAGVAADRLEAGRVHLQNGAALAADYAIVATGTTAACWQRASGLACDEHGFIVTNHGLQSRSHPQVFAAGDCAGIEDQPRPKSGVYAVKAGPPLAENLRRALRGDALMPYVPQERSLYLISTGGKYAIGSWGSRSWEGRWVWWWKDWIDRGFVGKYLVGG